MSVHRAAAGSVIAVVLTAGSACSSSGPSHDGPLHDVTDGSTVGQSIQAKANTPYAEDMRDLCTTAGSVHITKVTPWKPAPGIRIVDWGVGVDLRSGSTLSPPATGVPGRITKADGFTTGPVTLACNSTKADLRFYVSVATSRPRAWMYGATIYYDSDGDHYVTNTQMTLTLCSTGSLARCNPPKALMGD